LKGPEIKQILTYQWTGSRYPHQLTTSDFISEARVSHGLRYDYSKSEYVNSRTKVVITCGRHGDFEQYAASHIKGANCPLCVGNVKSGTKYFIFKADCVHGKKYDYSLSEYVNAKTKITIICPDHGVFEQQPRHHLNGHGCRYCAAEERVARKKHNKVAATGLCVVP
jgi:hypothetical protein